MVHSSPRGSIRAQLHAERDENAPALDEGVHDPGPISEDCLYLNVWTRAHPGDNPRAVLVWIHGGGFVEGSGSIAAYDGEDLAKKGLVVVTANYRLGIFGFFAHPDLAAESPHHATGNYGLLDQVAALRWIRANIAAFGGDPEHVTIFGQSAGATCADDLMASPLTEHLFSGAIEDSGEATDKTPPQSLDAAEKQGIEFGISKGVHSVDELRELSAQELIATVSGSNLHFQVDVDGWLLRGAPGAQSAMAQAETFR